MKEVSTKVGACLVAGGMILTAVLGGVAGAFAFPHQVEVTKEVQVPVEVVKEVVKEVPVDVIKEVQVKEPLNDEMLNFIQDRVSEDVTVEYIHFENSAKAIAEEYIASDFIGQLKEDDYFDDGKLLDNYRISEVSIKSIETPEIDTSDFEDKDVDLVYEVKLKAKESGNVAEYFTFEVTFPFKDGSLDKDDVDYSLI